MQTRPPATALLEAVASFLLAEVTPVLEAEKALQFRVLIAANLVTLVSQELATLDARLGAELAGLRALLHEPPGPTDLASLEALQRRLARALRAGTLDGADLDAARAHLLATARATLAVANPRFDTSDQG
jgi:hypothetical protein